MTTTTPPKSPNAPKTVWAALFGLMLCALGTNAFATVPRPDYIFYEGKKYSVYANLLGPSFEKLPKKPPESAVWSSAGDYIVTYEVVNNVLILKDFETYTMTKSRRSLDYGMNSVLKEVTGSDTLKIDWYTGSMVLGGGETLYGDGWFVPAIKEYHLLLEFENGVLIKETRMDYLEYLEYLLVREDGWVFSSLRNQYTVILEKLMRHAAAEKGEEFRFITELKKEYRKKFGEEMSDFESVIARVSFEFWMLDMPLPQRYEITVTRTTKGAFAKYSYIDFNDESESEIDELRVELSTAEWLDFVRALRKCRTDTWKDAYDEQKENGKRWQLIISSFGADKSQIFRGYDTLPPNWNAVKKTMDAMPPNHRGKFRKALNSIEAKMKKGGQQ